MITKNQISVVRFYCKVLAWDFLQKFRRGDDDALGQFFRIEV
jgi:hypothetical protein